MMASTGSLASTVNASATTPSTAASAQRDGASRPVKQNTAAKMTQKGRKESPSDSNRQSSTPKAWSGSSNPITQRSSTPNSGRANSSQNKSTSSASKMAPPKDTLSDKQNYDRLRYVFAGAVGSQVIFITKAGDKYEGVFAGFIGPPAVSKITLKMTKKVPANPITQPNGISSWEAAFAGSSPDYAMTFELKDMADMTIPEFSLPESSQQPNGTATSFRTDTDISAIASRSERVLQKWVPDATDASDFSLESGSAAGWDQFATHAKMTGGQSTYDEELYTTSINRNAPDFKRKEAEAARVAREIETQTSTNAHVREERGQALETDFGDEEDKYSGVRRDFAPLTVGAADRYTPPALRAPSSKPGPAGAPFDPAIISSQVARPDNLRSAGSQQSVHSKTELSAEKTAASARAVSTSQSNSDEPEPVERSVDLAKLTANGSSQRNSQPKQLLSPPSDSSQEVGPASQGVESKVLNAFKKFGEGERLRMAEQKRRQATQDRTAKINDLVRFAKSFKLKTPVPEDLVGILAKDPKKQEAIMDKAQRDHDDSRTTPTPASNSASSTVQLPPVPKFDKSQIPPPIPDRHTLNAGKATYGKQSLGRGARPLGQQMPFPGVPAAPRGQGLKNGQSIIPIPMPEIKAHQTTAGSSGVSSPRGADTPTSAVSTKFNVRAMEFRPTAAPFAPSNASVSAASPSPAKRTASIARSASPSSFFGQRKPKKSDERLDVTKKFNAVTRMKEEAKANLAKNTEVKRDYAPNGGIPNAYQTLPVWIVSDANTDKTYEDFFINNRPVASPAPNRTGPNQALPFHGPMQHMGVPQGPQAPTPQAGHHPHQYAPPYDDRSGHMQNGSPSMYTSPSMTPRGSFASPMGHPARGYPAQAYFQGPHGPVPVGYGNSHGLMPQHGQMTAPMMMAQHSSGPFIQQPQMMPGAYGSPRFAQAYPHQQNGFPSPSPMMAPVMMNQGSQQGYPGNQMMYPHQGHPGGMYNQQAPMRGYGGNHTPYGSSPHQPHHMNQRTMSSGYVKGMPQLPQNGTAPVNAPQQPASFTQMPVSEENK